MKANRFICWLMAGLMLACSEDEAAYKCKTCVETPDAIAANDNSGKGIYKGLVVGSSGTVKINISNDGSAITATLIFDGQTFNLTTTATYSDGFEGEFSSGNVSFGFWVNNDGSGFGIYDLVIPGHDGATVQLFKEKSTSLVRVYEGTFRGDANGVFNLVTRDDEWLVVAREDDDEDSSGFFGTLDGGEMTCMQCGEVDIIGKISDDTASGSWEGSEGEKGTWSGKRTL